jgi:hypothetical protein
MVLKVEGSLHLAALRTAFESIVDRHENLRTGFPAVEGSPIQQIWPSITLPLTVIDRDDSDVQSYITQQVEQPFRIDQAPLFRISVVRSHSGATTLVIVMHHIICDEWSLGVFLQEFSAFYGAALSGEAIPALPVPTQIADYAIWEAGAEARARWSEHREYWASQLRGLAPVDLFGAGQGVSLRAPRGSYLAFTVDQPTVESMRGLALQLHGTSSMVLLAAFYALLYYYTGHEDLGVGMPVANRVSWTESSIGFFVNELVIRVDVGAGPTFAELVGRVRERVLAAYAHQELPFDEIVAAARTKETRPLMALVNVQFDSHTAPFGSLALPGLKLTPQTVSRNSVQFDLQLSIEETAAGLQGYLGTNAEKTSAEWAQSFADNFVAIVRAAVEEPERKVDDLCNSLPGAAKRRPEAEFSF